MAMNQRRDHGRRADAQLLEDAIRHLRDQLQHAGAGWSTEPSDDGRHLIGTGSTDFRDVIIETHGPYAETIQQYLLTMDPDRTRSLLALLEDLRRGMSTGDITGGTRRAAATYAADVLGHKRPPIAPGAPR